MDLLNTCDEEATKREPDIVSDDNASLEADSGAAYDSDADQDNDGEDSLAAVASEDDDDYSEYVDECGRSRCSEVRNNGVAGFRPSPHYEQSNISNRRLPSRQESLISTTEATSLNIQQQLSYGPDGLVFNMNVPWERSLRRQMNQGLEKVITESSRMTKSYPSRPNDMMIGSGTMLLGHTESRDYAMEVVRDDISLTTSASSTAPNRMQVIHRSFLNNHMSYPQNNVNINNYNHINNGEYKSNQVEREIRNDYNVVNDNTNFDSCRIGNVIKGCRSADDSTVSYLTSHQYEDYPAPGPQLVHPIDTAANKQRLHESSRPAMVRRASSTGKQDTIASGSRGHRNSTSGRRSSSHGNSNNGVYGRSSSRNGDSKRSMKYELERTHSTMNSTVAPATIHSMAPDTSCFCMGYNVFDYVLPPPGDSFGRGTTNTGSTNFVHGMKVFNVRPSARLSRVEEGDDRVVDLTNATDLDMNYLRHNPNVERHHHPEVRASNYMEYHNKETATSWQKSYCGIDV